MCDGKTPEVKRHKALLILLPVKQPMFCKARNIPPLLQERVKEKLETIVFMGILELVQPGELTDALPVPVVWQRFDKVIDEDYLTPDKKNIFHKLH